MNNSARSMTHRFLTDRWAWHLGFYLLGGLFLGTLPGCQVGLKFQQPNLSMPQKWLQSIPEATQAEKDLAHWWTLFDDPTLTSLVDKAIVDNLDLKVALERIREARAARNAAASEAGPVLGFLGSVSRQQTSTTMQPGAAQTGSPAFQHGTVTSGQQQSSTVITDQYQTGFDAEWELDLFGRIQRTIEAGDADLKAFTESRRDLLVTIAADVARSYIELRTYQGRIDLARLHLAAQKKAAALTRQRFEGGLASGLDMANAEAQAADTAARIPLLEASARQSIYKLGILLGGDPHLLVEELTPAAELPVTPVEVPVILPSELLARRPDIRKAEAEAQGATARLGVAIADLYPRFTLTGSLSYLASALDSLYTPESLLWSFGGATEWSLFDSGRRRSQVDLREALQDQAVLAYRRTVLSALAEVENALIATVKEEEHRQALETSVRSNKKAVKIAEQLYGAGETDFLQVLIAERSLYAAQEALVQSAGASLTHLIALFKALGGGWEYSLGAAEPGKVLPGPGSLLPK